MVCSQETSILSNQCNVPQTVEQSQQNVSMECQGQSSHSGHCCCGHPDCNSFVHYCYQQPPRVESFKPKITYNRPTEPMEAYTTYKRSYFPIDACQAKEYRTIPIKQKDNIIIPCKKMDVLTVKKLSYPGHCGIKPPCPIKPPPSRLMGQGPIQTVTTQKHDYGPKPSQIRQPIRHSDNIPRPTNPLEKCTINKLSFIPIDVQCNPPPKPIKHDTSYYRAKGPIEGNSVYKLSYVPTCPAPKEKYPWAEKTRHEPPPYVDLATIYKCAYLPKCSIEKVAPIKPPSSLRIVGNEEVENETVYKKSYYGIKGERPAPIKPEDAWLKPKGQLEKCTIYQLSFLSNCNSRPPAPIKPPSSASFKSNEPVQSITTQKHDYVPKALCKVKPIQYQDNIKRPCAPIQKYTINKLSYIPIDLSNFKQSKPIKHKDNLTQRKGLVDNCTVYKISYMPICAGPKEKFPWAEKPKYRKPKVPMDTCTVQRTSYIPPGIFTKCCKKHGCKRNKTTKNSFPRAEIID